jgi:hypothetical protein
MHAVDILPTLVSAAAGADGLGSLLGPGPLDGMDMWRVIADATVADGPRTEARLTA